MKGFDLLLPVLDTGRLPSAARLVIGGDGAARADLVAEVVGADWSPVSPSPGGCRPTRWRGGWRGLGRRGAEPARGLRHRGPRGLAVRYSVGRHLARRSSEFVRDEVDGLVVDPEDTDALADAIGRVLTDKDLAGRLSEAGLRSVQRFTWPGVAATTCDWSPRWWRDGRSSSSRTPAPTPERNSAPWRPSRDGPRGSRGPASCWASPAPSRSARPPRESTARSSPSTPSASACDARGAGLLGSLSGLLGLVRHAAKVRRVVDGRSADVVVAISLKALVFGRLAVRRPSDRRLEPARPRQPRLLPALRGPSLRHLLPRLWTA